VCAAVLDAVVAEWHRDELKGEAGASCTTCGAPADVLITADRPPAWPTIGRVTYQAGFVFGVRQ
jgi:hypothetical protein